MPSRQEVFNKVQTCLVQALGVKPLDVIPEAALVDDLGAESIDFVDIIYRLEKSFDIKIPRGELFPQDLLRNPTYVNAGRLTAVGAEELAKRLDFTAIAPIEPGQEVEKVLGKLFTVGLIIDFVLSKCSQAATNC
jgi:acyl carrier protein